jgi:isopenicillin-N N-acyltransferase-like protein
MSKKQFQLIKLSGNPRERGRQYGTQAREKICTGIETYKKHFMDALHMEWAYILDRTVGFMPLLDSSMPELVEEARGIAEGAGVDFKEIMALNCRYEMLRFQNECTSTVILPTAAQEKRLILAQNWDYRPWVIDNTVLLHIETEDGTRIFGMAEAGQLVRNGCNSNGIGVCANSIKSEYDYKGVGIPVTFVRRKLLEQKCFSDAMKVILDSPRAVSNNYLLACKEGLAVDLEATPKKVYKIFPDDGVYAHANHIQTKEGRDIKKSESHRDKRLYDLLKQRKGSITIEYLKECLKDHEGHPEGICSHDPKNNDHKSMWQTNASLIYDLAQNRVSVCYGPPCEGEYIEYEV